MRSQSCLGNLIDQPHLLRYDGCCPPPLSVLYCRPRSRTTSWPAPAGPLIACDPRATCHVIAFGRQRATAAVPVIYCLACCDAPSPFLIDGYLNVKKYNSFPSFRPQFNLPEPRVSRSDIWSAFVAPRLSPFSQTMTINAYLY